MTSSARTPQRDRAPDALAAGTPPGLRDDLVALLGADCVLIPAYRSYSLRHRCQTSQKGIGDVGQQPQRRPGGSSGSVCWRSSLMRA
jgi:hypothetical protein